MVPARTVGELKELLNDFNDEDFVYVEGAYPDGGVLPVGINNANNEGFRIQLSGRKQA